MKQSLHKIVNRILRRIEEEPWRLPSENGIRSWLTGQGYTKTDVNAVLRVVRPQLSIESAACNGWRGLRSLSAWEDVKMTPEVRAALARLDLYQAIEPGDREVLLDRLSQLEGEVRVEDLEYVLSWLVAERDVESQRLISRLLGTDGLQMH